MRDVKDKKILSELLLNGRTPITQLAKKAEVSREVATYRIKKLEEEGVINGYHTLIDYESLGFRRHSIFMQLIHATPEKEQEILEYLKNHRYATYISPIIGKWNIVFDLIIPDDETLKETVKEISEHIKPHMGSFILLSGNIEGTFYPTKVVGIQHEIKERPIHPHELDETDKNILRILAHDARAEYAYLSGKLDMPATTIAHRIKRLEQDGVIQAYTCSVDYKKLGWQLYNIQLKHAEESPQFYAFIKEHPNIIYYYELLGHENWDIDVGVITKDLEELRVIMLEIKERFAEQIHIQNMYAIAEMSKDNTLPRGVLE